MHPAKYPNPRPRTGGAEPAAVPKYARTQTLSVTAPAGGAFSAPVPFSGTPDAIDVFCPTAGIVARLTDRMQQQATDVFTQANVWVSTYVSRDSVQAKDSAGAGGQVVTFLGKWAEEASNEQDPDEEAY